MVDLLGRSWIEIEIAEALGIQIQVDLLGRSWIEI